MSDDTKDNKEATTSETALLRRETYWRSPNQGPQIALIAGLFSLAGMGMGFGMSQMVKNANSHCHRSQQVHRSVHYTQAQGKIPWLGVIMHSVHSGVELEEVLEGSPAASAGLKPGDVIYSIDGATVRSSRQMIRRIRASSPGAIVNIRFHRAGKSQQVNAVLDGMTAQELRAQLRASKLD